MADPALWLLLFIVALAIGFGIVNGFNDAANAIATVIGTRTLSPRKAIILATFCNMAGAATGTAVAMTIGKGIITPEVISEFAYVPVIAALASVIVWGIPWINYHFLGKLCQGAFEPTIRNSFGRELQ